MVPGAGLEPATFGFLRCVSSFAQTFQSTYPMSPTLYQLSHPGDTLSTKEYDMSVSLDSQPSCVVEAPFRMVTW